MELVIGGYYRHFKGRLYQVKAIACHTETMEEMVIYNDTAGKTWARPKAMFLDTVQRNGEAFPRFHFEKEADLGNP